jgi:hypothetical protein
MPVHLSSRDTLRILDLTEIWAARTGNQVRLVSANDHQHTSRSAHYAGLALDLHTSDNESLARALRAAGYLVLWNVPGHYSHVHVQPSDAARAVARPFVPSRGVQARQ